MEFRKAKKSGSGGAHGRRTGVLGPALLAFLLAACARNDRRAFQPKDGDRLEILTNFTLALSKRDFAMAVGMISPSDRDLMLGADGQVKPEYQERLRAMRLTTLVHNPLISIEEEGRIRGVYHLLPVIDQGAPVEYSAMDLPSGGPEPSADPAAAEEERERQELRAAAKAFFRSVRDRKWNQALGMVDPGERQAFLKGDGKIKAAATRRLAAIDTSSWEALNMEAGKLSGVVLIIPATAPEGENTRMR